MGNRQGRGTQKQELPGESRNKRGILKPSAGRRANRASVPPANPPRSYAPSAHLAPRHRPPMNYQSLDQLGPDLGLVCVSYARGLRQVITALREEGLESSNLIVGIDFTKSNEWTATTQDEEVFSFHADRSPCHGFEEVLQCYKKIIPYLQLSGPTSFAPVIEAAIDIVESNGGQYHVLVIISDGQITKSVNTKDGDLTPQEKKTIDAIAAASKYALSIVLVGVGDKPWDGMKNFDDKIPAREFDNFQFVNFTGIMSRDDSPSDPSDKEAAAFALAALREIPIQYRATVEFGIMGRATGRAKKVVARPPPIPYTPAATIKSSKQSSGVIS